MDATVQLKLFASLSRHQPPDPDKVDIDPGETVQNLLERHGVPLEEVKLVFVNGVRKNLDTSLGGGERLGIFPPVGGG